MKLSQKLKRKRVIIPSVILLLLLSLVIGCWIYLSDCYKGDMDAIEAFMPGVEVKTENTDRGIVFGEKNSETGFVFYPGGKVEYKAYIPLMKALSEKGVFCILVDMPFNLAVLDSDAAEGVQEEYPEIEKWYIGGHSLGGAMAASFASECDIFAGLVLLGAYSTEDLSESNLEVLSLYGSEDGVMDREKYEKNKSNLPGDFKEIIIEGGNHAYFGMYGEQDGDGKATISNEEQILFTGEKILNLMGIDE